MAVTINASTSAGLVQTADTSGVLQLQSNGSVVVAVNSATQVSIATANTGGALTTSTTSGNWGVLVYDGANNASMLQFRNNAGAAAGNISLSSAGATSLLMSSVAGVNFPATQVSSANANTLDDYEEGTWTPAWSFAGGGSAPIVVQSSAYTKIGRLVTVSARIYTSPTSSPTGNAFLSGLPFSSSVETSGVIGEAARWATSLSIFRVNIESGSSTVKFEKNNTNDSAITYLQGSDFNSIDVQNILNFSITYVAS